MPNWKKILSPRILLMSIALSLSMLAVCPCPSDARDSNGVTVTDFTTGAAYGLHIDNYTAFNPTSATYIYNEAGESAAASGEVDLTGHFGKKTVAISVPQLGSTSLDFRLEGQVGTAMTTWGLIETLTIDATTTIDTLIEISEYITAYRLGVKVNTNGTDVINCSTSAVNAR